MKDALEYINTNHTPLYKKFDVWTLQDFGTMGSFDKHPKMKNAFCKDQGISDYALGTAKEGTQVQTSFIFSWLAS